MFLGFVRDRGAMIFTILIPVLFLVLLGSIYKSSSTPHLTVVEVGQVSLLDQAAGHGQLNQILKITKSRDLAAAVSDVRQGNDDAVVQQQGNALVVRYSIADQVTADGVPRRCVRAAELRAPLAPGRLLRDAAGYLVLGMQNVMARGDGPASALPAIGLLLGIAAVLTIISARVFRWDQI